MKALQTKLIAVILLIAVCLTTHAQEQKLCGTTLDSRSEKLIMDGLIPLDRLRTTAEYPYKLAITAHIIRREDGTGGLTEAQLESALETVNDFYKSANLEFFIFGDIDYVDSDRFFNYDAGDEVILANGRDVANTINIYFANSVTSSGSALCGYAYFPGNPDRILMDNSCTTNGTTLSHEIGHYLTLYHTHGKTNNGTTDELVDGSNCTTGGDEICDTPADPNLTGKVNSSCQYTSSQRDANGDLFQPNTENIMSYAPQSCRRLFTSGQFNRALSGYVSFRDYLISKPYNANFTLDQNIICAGNEITFSNLSLGEYETIEWEFINGSPTASTDENPTTSYSSPGLYDVQLTIYGTDGGIDTKVIENAVKVLEYNAIEATALTIDFESNTIDDFELHSPANSHSFSIERVGLESDQSLSFQFFGNEDNENDDFILLDPIENPGGMDYVLSFEYAFTYFADGSSERFDKIDILSKACGQWGSVWAANGKSEATSDPTSSSYSPTDQDWVHVEKYVPIDEASDFVQLAIRANSNNGNNFYIDNITVSYADGIVIRDIQITNELCAGDENGAIEVTASFNSSDITYSIDGESFQSSGLFSNLAGGSYQVTIKSGDETEVIDASVPVTSQKPAKPAIVYSNDELRLLSGATTIEWYFDGELIDDSGTTKITYRGSGDYYVIVRNKTGCENQSDVFTILGLAEDEKPIELFPNPVSNTLTIRAQKSTRFYITNLAGKLLEEFCGTTSETSIDVSSWPEGVYLIKGVADNQTTTETIIVSR